MAVAVTDVYSNPDPHIQRALRTLGSSAQKWAVFQAVYRGKKKRKTVDEIMKVTELSRKQVLMAGKPLERARLIHQESTSPVSYAKIDEIIHIRDDILRARTAKRQVPRKPTPPATRCRSSVNRKTKQQRTNMHDVFISHASEDKAVFVRRIAKRLREEGINVWYDEFSLKWGDSLRSNIDRGLASSRFGIVVLSPAFFNKSWPQQELDGLFALESAGRSRILPIWHNLTRAQVAEHSPMLAGRLALSSQHPVDDMISQLKDLLE